jgi:hypothetical protein
MPTVLGMFDATIGTASTTASDKTFAPPSMRDDNTIKSLRARIRRARPCATSPSQE